MILPDYQYCLWGHTSDIHCVGAGADHDDDDDVLIGLPDVAREAEKEEKKNSSHAAHRSQGQNEALVRGFPGNAAKIEDGSQRSPPGEPDGTRISPMVPMPPPAFGDNDEDLGIRDIDAELEAAIEESRGSIQLKLNRLVEELFRAAFILKCEAPHHILGQH